MSDLDLAKDRLRIPELWERLGLPGDCRKNPCHSPFREDRHASFSIFDEGRAFNDLATGQGGSAIDFLQLATGLPRKEACRRFVELAGERSRLLPAVKLPRMASVPRERPIFPDFEKGGNGDFRRLASLRNLSMDGVRLASDRGLLWFADLRGFEAWVVTDAERVNAQARRLDGGLWEHLESAPKAWTLSGSWAGWPIGAREAQTFPKIAFVEGGPDLLAACHFMWCEDRERDVAPVGMMGASQRIHEDTLAIFAGKRVRLFPHLDEAGQQAAARWTQQLETVGADVDECSFAGLHRRDGEAVTDLNDLSSICPDDFEKDRETWGVMP